MAPRALIIGGSRFLGIDVVFRLLAAGYEVTILNRGTRTDPFGGAVRRLRVDRRTPAFLESLRAQSFDAVVDLAAYTEADTSAAVEVFEGRTGHYVFISSGQVYLVGQGYRAGAREGDYDAPLLMRPTDPFDLEQWQYGIDKRAAEDVLATAWRERRFPSTRLRLPMVHGPRDHYRRLESYLWRFLDGGPVLIPPGHERVARHVYSGAVARAIVDLLLTPGGQGKAFNLAAFESPSILSLLRMTAQICGADPTFLEVDVAKLEASNLRPLEVSPLSGHWMSCLDPTAARETLGFVHENLPTYLALVVTGLLSRWPAEPPPGYNRRRLELALAESRSARELA